MKCCEIDFRKMLYRVFCVCNWNGTAMVLNSYIDCTTRAIPAVNSSLCCIAFYKQINFLKIESFTLIFDTKYLLAVVSSGEFNSNMITIWLVTILEVIFYYATIKFFKFYSQTKSSSWFMNWLRHPYNFYPFSLLVLTTGQTSPFHLHKSFWPNSGNVLWNC